MALVHLPEGGRCGASFEPLCDDPSATNRFRASGRQHLIKGRHADGSLRLLRGETGRAQSKSDQRLVAAHHRFAEQALTIAGCDLPGEPPSFRDHFQMVIKLRRLIRFVTGHSRRTRWNHHVDGPPRNWGCRDELGIFTPDLGPGVGAWHGF
jgi:hypothetical protein